MMNVATNARRLLINFGKVVPFALCFIVFVSYLECLLALLNDNLVQYGDAIIPYTPLSFLIAGWFEYDMLTMVVILIITVAIETCKWNKLCVFYLLVQLEERKLFSHFELYIEYIYMIVVINVLVSGYLTYKGMTLLLK